MATLNSLTHPLSQVDSVANQGATHLVVIKYTDCTAAATTQDWELTLPHVAASRFQGFKLVKAVLKAAFTNSNAATSAIVLISGTGTTNAAYLAGMEMWSGGTMIWLKPGIDPDTTTGLWASLATANVRITVTSANVSTMTAGEVHIYLIITDSDAEKSV